MKAVDNKVRDIARQAARIAAVMAIGGAALAPAMPARAQQVVTGGWFNVGLVTRVHPGDGTGMFYFSTATQLAIAACTQSTYGYAFADGSTAANRNYATLLMAYSTGKPIAIHLTGGCSPGAANRPLVDTVEITDVPYY